MTRGANTAGWNGHWAGYAGWGAAGPVASRPRRRWPWILGTVLAVLLGLAALFAVFAAMMWETTREAKAQTNAILFACAPYGDGDECREAMGPGIEPEKVEAMQTMLAGAEQSYGPFETLDVTSVCSFAMPGGSMRELRARVQWGFVVEPVAFQWREVDGGWRLITAASANRVPRLCG